jgi:hypothetical protein
MAAWAWAVDVRHWRRRSRHQRGISWRRTGQGLEASRGRRVLQLDNDRRHLVVRETTALRAGIEIAPAKALPAEPAAIARQRATKTKAQREDEAAVHSTAWCL